MKFMSFNRLLRAGAAVALLTGVASTQLSANTIDMVGYNGPGDKVTCAPMCSGFVAARPPLVEISLSDSTAHKFDQAGSPTGELARLNELLALFDPARPAVTYVNKTNVAGKSFTTSLQYFSIKKATDLFFFENTSGASVTVALTSSTEAYSHWTEYGPSVSAVPVPAALWLFGSAMIGLVGFGKQRKAA